MQREEVTMSQPDAGVTIRKMAESDLPRVNEIDRMLFGQRRVPTWPFSFAVYWDRYKPERSFVAEAGGQVAGFLVGSVVVEEHSQSVLNLKPSAAGPPEYRQVAWIDMIGVDPAYQSAGLGRSLVDAFCSECDRLNVPVKGVAREDDARLRGFLEKAGFKAAELIVYERR
jgi:ribosomal protein S18 acetylase RimI-like enzyme